MIGQSLITCDSIRQVRVAEVHCKGEPITLTHLTSQDTVIEAKSEVTDLGVLMSIRGSFKGHVEEIIMKDRERLSWISRVFLTRDPIPMLTLYRALVLPILEYLLFTVNLWHPVQLGISRSLQVVQRSFASRLGRRELLNYWN